MKLKKDEGFVQYCFCIMLFAICALIIVYSVRMRVVQQQKQYLEDGITTAALSSAVVDLNEYGTYNYVRSGSNNYWDEEEDRMLQLFKDALKVNLNLKEVDGRLYPADGNGIITGEVRIVNYWVYEKEVKPYIDEAGHYVLIRDYNENWVRQHYQTNDWYILKYQANLNSQGKTTGSYFYDSQKVQIPVYTPEDKGIINGSNGVDGAGTGQVLIADATYNDTGMAVYATLQFEVNPMGYNKTNTTNSGIYGFGSIVGDTTVTKSVVVAIKNKYDTEAEAQ